MIRPANLGTAMAGAHSKKVWVSWGCRRAIVKGGEQWYKRNAYTVASTLLELSMSGGAVCLGGRSAAWDIIYSAGHVYPYEHSLSDCITGEQMA